MDLKSIGLVPVGERICTICQTRGNCSIIFSKVPICICQNHTQEEEFNFIKNKLKEYRNEQKDSDSV